MPTSQDRSTDRPLSDPLLDDFQRAPFAKRLAETLLTPSHTASIVVGLYGKWGEKIITIMMRHPIIKRSKKKEMQKTMLAQDFLLNIFAQGFPWCVEAKVIAFGQGFENGPVPLTVVDNLRVGGNRTIANASLRVGDYQIGIKL